MNKLCAYHRNDMVEMYSLLLDDASSKMRYYEVLFVFLKQISKLQVCYCGKYNILHKNVSNDP